MRYVLSLKDTCRVILELYAFLEQAKITYAKKPKHWLPLYTGRLGIAWEKSLA